MKIKVLLYIALFLFKGNTVLSQTKVNIGDKAPDYVFSNLINSTQKEVNLQSFKGKVLILDFWDSSCATCVASWPKLMDLQQKFKDQVQIIIVNPRQNEQIVKAVIKKQEKIHGYKMTLVTAYGDDRIKKIFPYVFVPHVVFIDQSGMVKYITDGTTLNEETLGNIIDQESIKISEKTDEYPINIFKRLYIDGNIGKKDTGKDVMWSSVITPYSPEIFSTTHINSIKEKSIGRGFMGNYPLKAMFSILYGKSGDLFQAIRNSRIMFRDVDSTKLVMKIDHVVRKENLYTYQLRINKALPLQQIKAKMISDLELYFGLKTFMEKQKRKCIVISRSKMPLTEYQAGPTTNIMAGMEINVNNISMDEFITKLDFFIPSFYSSDYPFVDETGFTGKLGKISFETKNKEINYAVLKKELSKHGLELSIHERQVDVLVITQAGYNQ